MTSPTYPATATTDRVVNDVRTGRRFAGRTALVTGASRGIGAATAARLAAEGANVVLAARSADALEGVAAEIRATGASAISVPTDLADPEQLRLLVDAALAEYAGLDVLVNNAGVLPPPTRSHQLPLDDWERTLRLNLTAPWLLANLCHEPMAAAGGGVVVNVTSTAAFYPSVGLSAYNASKAGLTLVSKGLALEWARDNIRVVTVAPGKTDTELAQPVLDYATRTGRRVNPLGRVAHPDEVAGLIAFAASDDASFMTGNVLTIDGGELAGTGADQGR